MDEFQLNAEKDQWCATAPDEISQLVGDINGPLIRYLMTQVVMDDKQLLHDLHEGFPLLGMMPEIGYGKTDDLYNNKVMLTTEELRLRRAANNVKVLAKVHECEHSEDGWQQTVDDSALGKCTYPTPITKEVIKAVSLAPRIPVREYREHEGVWRTRVVDNLTVSEINPGTKTKRKT